MVLTLREQGKGERPPALGRASSGSPCSIASPPYLFA